jgi:hypothetical protein
MYLIEQDLRTTIEQVFDKSVVAYMDWLVNTIMSIIWFDFAQKPAE